MTSKVKLTIAALAACALTSCSNNETTQEGQPATAEAPIAVPASLSSISNMAWLAGKWQTQTPEGIAFEHWKIVDDSTMAGISGFIKGKDTMISETISLEQRNGVLSYIPTVKNQNDGKPVPFKLAEAAGDSFVFSNPAHDFPDKITYAKKSATSLMARISGKMGGKEMAEVFPLTKVE